MPKRVRMSLRLSKTDYEFPHEILSAERQYLEEIASCALDAYQDTVDYEGEDLAQTIEEVQRVYAGFYGPLMTEASFIYREDETVYAGLLTCLYRGEPTITYTFTRKSRQRMGYATQLIGLACQRLYELGYHSLFLYVTMENVDALRLYESLGFQEVPLTTLSEINID
ncbi:GNAT family N-acetyltransferase [Proteiniclasticum ruminis]|uniref:L-amino acid N-acyltransferase YncA n=1 Tax=Proteiniclasticum ruminis TaxID=398199 RepID=A0A1I4Y6G9_9CLOT|nr:GNAT family N-acetyltransferase [Proteiniclasticum ruminis]SFN33666.1 L-amino acid N-acyltransferase YncA [Proteiniclasticum ruminis]